jgi:hypothetical protein
VNGWVVRRPRTRGPDNWSIILDLGAKPGGGRKQKWIVFHGSRDDAEQELFRILRGGNMPLATTNGKTLLQQALSAGPDMSGTTSSAEEIELALAWVNGQVSFTQVAKVVLPKGKKTMGNGSAVYHFLARALRDHILAQERA